MVAVQIAETVDRVDFAVRRPAGVVEIAGFDAALGMEIGVVLGMGIEVVLDTGLAAALAVVEAACCIPIASEDKERMFRAMADSETAHIVEHSRKHRARG